MECEEILALIDERIAIFVRLLERDFWDYAAIVVPSAAAVISVIISVIALCHSNNIAKRQNKIVLFDKRYSAYNVLQFLASVAKHLVDGTVKESDQKFYLDVAVETFKSISNEREITSDCKDALDLYVRLIFEAGKIAHLYKSKRTERVIEFLQTLDQYVADIYAGRMGNKMLLESAVKKIEDEKINKMLVKALALWNC